MKCIITEKPSVAKDFVAAIGDFQSKDGYFENQNYYVTWAIGHLLEINNKLLPEKWDIATLPIFPEKFDYIASEGKSKQLNTIRGLLNKSDDIIIATDAGREGELIARLILMNCGWKNWDRVFRFWTSQALSKEVIIESLKSIKPGKDYIDHFYKAYSRQHADWIVGINTTRLVTCKAGTMFTIGRVQTPTIKLIADRNKEHDSFISTAYFIVSAKLLSNENVMFKALLETKQDEKIKESKANDIVGELQNVKKALVSKLDVKIKNELPPLLHSITSLQTEANTKYKLTAQQTLNIVQALYEKYKCVSYPRTDSQHMGEDNVPLVKSVIKGFNNSPYGDIISTCIENVGKVGKRVFDNSKLTDHHALIPLKPSTEELNDTERKVYNLICIKFFGAFLGDYVFESTKGKIKIGEYFFEASGHKPVKKGWRQIYESGSQNIEDALQEDDQLMPKIFEGQTLAVESVENEKRMTAPPEIYSEGNLLKLMKKLSLGTQATRAGIIEKIISVGYIERKKNKLLITEKGKELLKHIENNIIASPEMTSEWEKELEKVGSKADYFKFISEVKEFTTGIIEQLKNVEIKQVVSSKQSKLANSLAAKHKITLDKDKVTDTEYISSVISEYIKKDNVIGKCMCGGDLIENKYSYNCKNCDRMVWKELKQFSKKLNEKQALSLLKGEIIYLKGLKGKTKKFDAKLELQKGGNVKLIFD